MNLTIYMFSFAVGCAIGSFLNVCIYRLPREMSVVLPPSHCPSCGQYLAWYDNVPVLSYLCLGGKCRHCGVIISGRYALVELLTGLLFMATIRRFSPDGVLWAPQAAVGLILASALLAASFIDIERQVIPDEITYPGAVLGCLAGLFFPQIHAAGDPLIGLLSPGLPAHAVGLIASIAGAAVGAGFIYLTGLAGKVVFRKEAMGLGDVKLMAMIGAFLGWRVALLSIFLGCVFGAVIGVSVIIVARKRDTRIPFGPYLSLGALSMVFFEPQVLGAINWWQHVAGG